MRKISCTFAIVVVTALGGCAMRVDSGEPLLPNKRAASAKPSSDTDAQNTVPHTTPATPPPSQGTVAPLPAWDLTRTFTGLRSGHITGAVGDTSVDAATNLASVYDDGYYAEIEAYAKRSDGRRVMIELAVENGDGPFLRPGVGERLISGGTSRSGASVMGVGCAGPDGAGTPDEAFAYTDYDEQPCNVGVDTEQDPNDPQALDVTLQAVFADENGNCDPMPGDDGNGDAPLPDTDGDGDGDLPGCGGDNGTQPPATPPALPPQNGDEGGNNPGGPDGVTPPANGNTSHPLATTSFVLTR